MPANERRHWNHIQVCVPKRGKRLLATLCGARGTRAIADFAGYLNKTQLRLLRAYRNPKTGEYEAPSEPTIRRMLKRVPAAELDAEVMDWMKEQDPHPLKRLAVDGKTIKGSRRGDGRPVHLVAAVTPETLRLVAQRPGEDRGACIYALDKRQYYEKTADHGDCHV